MNQIEKGHKPSLKDIFPNAISTQSVKIETGDEVLLDPTPARRCIVLACRDDNTLSEIHLNNGETSAEDYANMILRGLKSFYQGKFKVILMGGDEIISQHYVDAVEKALESDPQIIFDKENSDTGGTWVRSVRVNPDGVDITRQIKSGGELQTIKISFLE